MHTLERAGQSKEKGESKKDATEDGKKGAGKKMHDVAARALQAEEMHRIPRYVGAGRRLCRCRFSSGQEVPQEIKTEQPDLGGQDCGGCLEAAGGESSHGAPTGCTQEFLAWPVLQCVKQEPEGGLQQRWEAQWREFLKTLQAPEVPRLRSGMPRRESQAPQTGGAEAGPGQEGGAQTLLGLSKTQDASVAVKKEMVVEEGTIIQFCYQAEESQEASGPLQEVAAVIPPKSETVPLDQVKMELSVEVKQEGNGDAGLLVWQKAKSTIQPARPPQAGLHSRSPERAKEEFFQGAKRHGESRLEKRAKVPFPWEKEDREALETGEQPSACTPYVVSFLESSHLVVPQRSFVGEKLCKCSDGGESFAKETGLIKPAATHIDDKSHVCLDCGKSFHSNSHLRAHTRIHTGEKPFECVHCRKIFGTVSHLKRHTRVHTGESPFKCSECGKSFTQKPSLIKHRRTHTGEKPYKCPECGKSYRDSSCLLRHTRAHTGEKPYQCSWCENRFIQRSDLIRHEGTHTGEKPYECPECGKAFGQKGSLIKHEGVHTGKNPYGCLDCGKSFSRKQSLMRHKSTHTGEKPYECPSCGKSFSTSAHLSIHERVHRGEKPYQCAECGKHFCRKPSLVTHKRIHAGKKS